MIAPEFLAMLVCPASHRPLRAATAAELQVVAAAIAAGTARTNGGAAVTDNVTEGLVPTGGPDGSSAGGVLYPIREGIPILLSSEAIVLPTAT